MSSKQFNSSLDYIYHLERMSDDFNLDNIKKFLLAIDNPQKKLKAVHIAGTNGKGSVCYMIQQSLIANGYKTGMFTSPHLVKFNERIRINNKLISNKDVDRLTNKIKLISKKKKITLTFFETITIMAYLYFLENKVDFAVIETGLGGKLDATNTCKPIVTVITKISKDHQETLGHTIKDISEKKSGIIKKRVPIITANKWSALRVIKKQAEQKQAPLIIARKRKLGLKGYLKENAEVAYAACEELMLNNIEESIKAAKWPGRLDRRGNIILDCAHNPDGAKALAKTLKAEKIKIDYVICGFMRKTQAEKVSRQFRKLKPKKGFIITKPDMTTAKPISESIKYFKKKNTITTPDLKTAIKYAEEKLKKEKNEGKILITGSIFLVGEAIKIIS